MAAKKKGKLGGAGASGAVKEKDILYTAQQIWQAGLGALAKAQAGAPRVFDELMREGGKPTPDILPSADQRAMPTLRRHYLDRAGGGRWDETPLICP